MTVVEIMGRGEEERLLQYHESYVFFQKFMVKGEEKKEGDKSVEEQSSR